jgi:nucleotide-binding universal stress UspA family protein
MNLAPKRIIYATDLSERSKSVLPLASVLARDSQGTLLITHVVEPAEPVVGMTPAPVVPYPEQEKRAEDLKAIRPDEERVRCEHRLLQGDPADSIVKLAKEEGADLIVMSTHGRTGLARLLMGSVAEAVVRQAPCPVLTIRQPNVQLEEV